MSVVEKAIALLTSLTPEQLRAASPLVRRHLADQCRRCADLAERRQDKPQSGVLHDLRIRGREEV